MSFSPAKGLSMEPVSPNAVVIKKYANRRLYNTAASAYITQDALAGMVRAGVEFVVRDAKTNEDITRQVLTQIILDQEASGGNLLPTSFLRQLIMFYGDSLQVLVPRYLDATMGTFARNQDRLRQYVKNSMPGAFFAYNPWEELNRQNQSLWNNLWNFPNPLAAMTRGPGRKDGGEPGNDAKLDDLQKRVDDLQKQLARLVGEKS